MTHANLIQLQAILASLGASAEVETNSPIVGGGRGLAPYVGDIDEIVGAILDDEDDNNDDADLGVDLDDELEDLLSGDPNMGADEIIGAIRRNLRARRRARVSRSGSGGRSTGRHVVTKQSAESELKWELLPIGSTTLAAGVTQAVNVTPIRTQRLDQVEFPSSNVDHQHMTLLSVMIAGQEQLNGTGGIRLSQLSEMRTHNILRGATAQRNEPLIFTFQNNDTANSRTLYGSVGGPTIR